MYSQWHGCFEDGSSLALAACCRLCANVTDGKQEFLAEWYILQRPGVFSYCAIWKAGAIPERCFWGQCGSLEEDSVPGRLSKRQSKVIKYPENVQIWEPSQLFFFPDKSKYLLLKKHMNKSRIVTILTIYLWIIPDDPIFPSYLTSSQMAELRTDIEEEEREGDYYGSTVRRYIFNNDLCAIAFASICFLLLLLLPSSLSPFSSSSSPFPSLLVSFFSLLLSGKVGRQRNN